MTPNPDRQTDESETETDQLTRQNRQNTNTHRHRRLSRLQDRPYILYEITTHPDITFLFIPFITLLIFLHFCLFVNCHSGTEIYLFILLPHKNKLSVKVLIFAILDILTSFVLNQCLPTSLYFCVKILAIVRPFLYQKLTKYPLRIREIPGVTN
jgi:hypothetical protein